MNQHGRALLGTRIAALLQRLSRSIQEIAPAISPKYFLPSQVILKTRKPDWDDEFDNEKAMHKRLEPLQGRIIPAFLGEAKYDKSPAIILSYIDGILPFAQDKECPLTEDKFESLVESAIRAFAQFGVAYGDTKLDNFLICGDFVKLVDLESVCEETELIELAVPSHLDHVMGQYRSYLKSIYDYY